MTDAELLTKVQYLKSQGWLPWMPTHFGMLDGIETLTPITRQRLLAAIADTEEP